jgi:hypothetical protein
MNSHFIFAPGEWLGTGQVTFTMSPDLLYFRTKWSCFQPDEESFVCTQRVEIIGGDTMINVFTVKKKNPTSFDIVLQNETLGVFSGTGVIEENLVAWEFRSVGTFEGYEVYEKQHDEEYAMHAEYLSGDGARTRISGKIWKSLGKFEFGQEFGQEVKEDQNEDNL